ncbi:MAG TPA: outer membrane beta-barrel protein [Opitutaceae bacterium]|nr:outer membrane beta-barrel protein [Opitutaceae bacterium]
MKIRTKLAGLAALVAALSASAQIKVNDNLSFTGWATGSYQYTKPSPGTSFDSFNVDAGLLQATVTPTKNVTGVMSVYYRPSGEGGVSPSGSEVTLLDAYVTYDTGTGLTATAGKFLSYLGYESFYQISDNMITLANQSFLAPIPGYHEGVKFDYTVDKTTVFGAALVDSDYPKPGYNATEGDGELKHNGGAEGYVQYTGIDNLTVWMGVGYDSKGNFEPHDVWVYDIWASYQIDKTSTVAAEEIYKDGGNVSLGTDLPKDKGSNWLVYYQYNFTDQFYSWFAVSGEDASSGASYVKYSISPTYNLTANLSARAQYSYTNYHKYVLNDANFIGGEILFKF